MRGSRPWRRFAPALSIGMALAAASCDGANGDDDPTPADDDSAAPDDDTTPPDDDTSPATGFSLAVSVAEVIPTVIVAEWSHSDGAASEAWIEVGPDTGYGRRVAVDTSGAPPYRTLVLGQKPGVEVHVRVSATVGGEAVVSDDHAVTTGSPPPSLPGATVTEHDPYLAQGGYLVGSIVSSPSHALVLDADGDPVWWYQPDDPDALISRARFSLDGTAMLMLKEVLGGPDQALYRVGLDGTGFESSPLFGAHHDFVELPDGTIVAPAYDAREIDGETVEGDKLVEYAPDGSTREFWTAWDYYSYDPEEDHVAGTAWTHANAIDYLASEDAFAVSLLGQGSIVKVRRDTGELYWTIGGETSDFRHLGAGVPFSFQHQFELDDSVIRVFDNGPTGRLDSRGVEVAFDESLGTMEVVWSYSADPPLYNYSLGDVLRLPNGNTRVNFSSLGQVDEVTPGGLVVWRLNMGLGGAFGFTEWKESFDAIP